MSYEDHTINIFGSTSVAQEYGDLYATWAANVEDDPQPGDLAILDPYDRVTSHNAPTDRDTRTKIWSLNMQWDISDSWSLTSVTSDQDYSGQITGIDGSGFTNSEGLYVEATSDLSVGPYKIAGFNQDQGSDGVTQEFRATFESDTLSSIVGVFYSDTSLYNYVPFTSPLGALPGGRIFEAAGISDLSEDAEEWAIFNHNIWTIREGLDLTVGVRYSEVEKTSHKAQLTGWGPLADLNTPPVPVAPWGDEDVTQQDKWDAITGTLKLTWWMNDEIALYGGWDRGFKAGGHNVCKGTDVTPDCPEPFAEETADNFEVGFKGRFFENALVWNAAVFTQLYDDYQVEIQDEVGVGNSILNAAKTKIEGVETDFQWLATPNLLIDGSVSYVDARWDEYEDAGCIRAQYQRVACTNVDENGNNVQDLSGKRLNYTSPWTANLNMTWDDEFSNGMGWYLRGEYAYRGDRFFMPDLDPAVTDGAYGLFNASLGLTSAEGNWDVILWAKNITDEDYLITGSRNRDFGNPAFGPESVEGYRVTPGEERTYGVTLKYRFEKY